MTDQHRPVPSPNGFCFCGCNSPTRPGNYWAQGHDKKAESDMNAILHLDSVVQRLVDAGFGPTGRNLHLAAITAGVREACGVPGCGTSGIPGGPGLRQHRAKVHGVGKSSAPI